MFFAKDLDAMFGSYLLRSSVPGSFNAHHSCHQNLVLTVSAYRRYCHCICCIFTFAKFGNVHRHANIILLLYVSIVLFVYALLYCIKS